jgi:hypothetical protein
MPNRAIVEGRSGGISMYLALIVLLMAVLPLQSIIVEMVAVPGADLLLLLGKWFVFWAVGVRLILAGARQVAQPSYTAQTIFGIKDPDSQKLVTEIGFGNLSIGLLGLLTIVFTRWIAPAALAGALFYGLAGIKHIFNIGKNRTEAIATISDLAIFVVLGIYLATIATR